MAKMSFDHGGRRCIRPILEQYQSGMDEMLDFGYHVVGKSRIWKVFHFFRPNFPLQVQPFRWLFRLNFI